MATSKRLDILTLSLQEVEQQLKGFAVDDKTQELMILMRKRVKLGKEISQAKWESKTMEEKEEFRKSDLKLMEKYFNKYGDEVASKFNYKKKYILLTTLIRNRLVSAGEGSRLLSIILEILDSEEYINIKSDNCLSIVFEHLKKEDKKNKHRDILDTYSSLKNEGNDVPIE